MARGRFAVFGAQWFEQVRQAVMVDLLHQREQATQFAVRETFTGKPVQVRPRQVGKIRPLYLPKGISRVISSSSFSGFIRVFVCLQNNQENTGILHAGQMTDHANNRDTDSSLIFNLLINNDFYSVKKLARSLQYPLHLQPIVRN
jgi:hypothetical protein